MNASRRVPGSILKLLRNALVAGLIRILKLPAGTKIARWPRLFERREQYKHRLCPPVPATLRDVRFDRCPPILFSAALAPGRQFGTRSAESIAAYRRGVCFSPR